MIRSLHIVRRPIRRLAFSLLAALALLRADGAAAQSAADAETRIFKDWRMICATPAPQQGQSDQRQAAPGAQRFCLINHQVRAADQNRVIVGIRVRFVGAERRPVLTLVLPPQAAAGKSVLLAVDQNQAVEGQIGACNQQFCLTRAELTEELIRQMRAGQKLIIAFPVTPEQRGRVEASLAGFTQAFEALRATGL